MPLGEVEMMTTCVLVYLPAPSTQHLACLIIAMVSIKKHRAVSCSQESGAESGESKQGGKAGFCLTSSRPAWLPAISQYSIHELHVHSGVLLFRGVTNLHKAFLSHGGD